MRARVLLIDLFSKSKIKHRPHPKPLETIPKSMLMLHKCSSLAAHLRKSMNDAGSIFVTTTIGATLFLELTILCRAVFLIYPELPITSQAKLRLRTAIFQNVFHRHGDSKPIAPKYGVGELTTELQLVLEQLRTWKILYLTIALWVRTAS